METIFLFDFQESEIGRISLRVVSRDEVILNVPEVVV